MIQIKKIWLTGFSGPKRMMLGVVSAVVVLIIAGAVQSQRNKRAAKRADVPLYTVERGPLTISVTESGNIENKEKIIVRSQVQGTRATIIWLVDEGTAVKKGDLLTEIDASEFEDQLIDQQIQLENSIASVVRAEETLQVTKSQAEADVEKAELTLKFAKIDFEKYEEGEYPEEKQKAEANIAIAKEELKRAQDKLEWSKKLNSGGFITRSELQADELALKRKNIDLQLAESALNLLEKYTRGQQMEKRKSDVKQASLALDRAKIKANADIMQAEVDLRTKKSLHKRNKDKLDKTIEKITNCKITAPADGMVVYATSQSRGRHSRGEPLAVGQTVRERQELIHLPTTASMVARISIQETSLMKVKIGMTTRIIVDALPGEVFSGKLSKISALPDTTQSWLNPDLKVYNCEVDITDSGFGLRPGMSGHIEIIVAEYQDAIYVPIQTVLLVDDVPTVYVMTRIGPKPRKLKTGLDNNRMIHVLEGLEEGDQLLLAPPFKPSSVKPGHRKQLDTKPRQNEEKEVKAGGRSTDAKGERRGRRRKPN